MWEIGHKVELAHGMSAVQEYDDLNKMPYVSVHIDRAGLDLLVIRINGALAQGFGRWNVAYPYGHIIAML